MLRRSLTAFRSHVSHKSVSTVFKPLPSSQFFFQQYNRYSSMSVKKSDISNHFKDFKFESIFKQSEMNHNIAFLPLVFRSIVKHDVKEVSITDGVILGYDKNNKEVLRFGGRVCYKEEFLLYLKRDEFLKQAFHVCPGDSDKFTVKIENDE